MTDLILIALVVAGCSLLLAVVMTGLFLNQRDTVLAILPFLKNPDPKKSAGKQTSILVDTSVIIDGRIADIAKAGFVPGVLLVPRFVLAELQNIADSEDALRRSRGRRGLEVLNELGRTEGVTLEIHEEDPADIKEVDAKLVALGRKLGANILTTDFNLNRVAQFEGVRVLNINELSNAIRPVVLPGEDLNVRIVQAGKERRQGVGYLADGTMIVVEDGDALIGQDVMAEVTRVFQTVAGKMIFATPKSLGSGQSLQQKVETGSSKNRNANGKGKRGNRKVSQKEHTSGAIEDRLVRDNKR